METWKPGAEAQADAVRLLRRRDSKLYYTGEGWTDSSANAQPYPNDDEAVRACVAHDLQHVDLVLRLPGGGEMSVTPLR